MQRRAALQAVGLMMGSAYISPLMAKILSGYRPQEKTLTLFSSSEQALIIEIAETIIPETTSPGAKAAGLGTFIPLIVEECFSAEEQTIFKAGLEEIDQHSQTYFKKNFVDLDEDQRIRVLSKVEADAQSTQAPFSFWFRIKSLTVTGFFTSEVGAKQALEYVWVPGRYEACTDLKPGQKTWAY